jgi:carboxylate-amine ligase
MSDAYRFGIEEEYFLVDAGTKEVAREAPAAFLDAALAATAGQIKGEPSQPRIEAATVPHVDMTAARNELRHLRVTLGSIAAEHGLAIMAAGTHPTAPAEQEPTAAERTNSVIQNLTMRARFEAEWPVPGGPQHAAEQEARASAEAQHSAAAAERALQRTMLCALHIHVELPDPEDRADMMIRMMPYLPLLVALSTSSPFWQSRPTGLKDSRLAAYDELPRTGIPELFRTPAEYKAYIAALTRAGVIEDSSQVWWAIRPSLRHPTLELRALDCCTRVEDSIAIAALYRALARRLTRDPWANWDLSPVARAIAVENNWRAQRYGVTGTFVDEVQGAVSVADQLDHVIEEVRRDAEALHCLAEVEHCRAIVGGGTSADVQLAVFEEASVTPQSGGEPLHAVNDWIAEATLE